jgi:hypothetical protein
MAFLGCEGFDYLTFSTPDRDLVNRTLTPSGGVWSSTLGNSTKGPASGVTGSVLAGASIGGVVQCLIPSTYTTLIVGARLALPTDISTVRDLISFIDSNAAVQCGISINTSGNIIFWRGTNATVLATGSTVFAAGAIHYFELEVTIDNSAGVATLNVDTVQEISASGLDTQATGIASASGFKFPIIANLSQTIDDVYALDTTGPAPYNTFLGTPSLGPPHVETLFSTANSSVGFTPLASTNVSQIQEVDSDNDTTYNSTTVPAIDEFTHGALSITPTLIFAAEVVAKEEKDDLTIMSVRTKLLSGATTSNGPSLNPVNGTYRYDGLAFTADPNTGFAWNVTSINASIVGYERVS